MKLRRHLESARRRLADYPAAQLEAEILLAHSLDSPRSFLYANPELEIPRKHHLLFKKLVQRRVQGEPIASHQRLRTPVDPDIDSKYAEADQG